MKTNHMPGLHMPGLKNKHNIQLQQPRALPSHVARQVRAQAPELTSDKEDGASARKEAVSTSESTTQLRSVIPDNYQLAGVEGGVATTPRAL